MKAGFFCSSDAELFAAPEVWDLRAYSLSPKTFNFTVASLEAAPGVHIDCTVINGHLRTAGALRGKGLFIKFAEARSERAYLQSMSDVQSAMVITPAGCVWDGLSSHWARCFSIHLDAARTAAVLDSALRAKVDALTAGPAGRRGIVTGISRAGHQLRRRIREMLAHVEAAPAASAPVGAHHVFDLGAEAPGLFAGYGEALLEMARNVIEEACGGAFAPVARPASVRLELARQVEALLWAAPDPCRDGDYSLDEVAQRLKTSRRTLQTAVQEYFGLGFVAYRKFVRLNQLRQAIAGRDRHASLTRLGLDFHFTHPGRLAADYRALFGRLPSDDFRAKP